VSAEDYFNRVYDETHTDIVRAVTAKCNGIPDLDDIVQRIYIRFYKYIIKKGWADIENPKAFLINLLKYEVGGVFDERKKNKEFQPEYIPENDDPRYAALDAAIAKDQPLLDVMVENTLFAKQVYDDIVTNDPVTGKIFYLYFAEDMKLADIAELLEMNQSSVKTKLYRELERQQDKLGLLKKKKATKPVKGSALKKEKSE
jgi:RNA polymerase sigma-70 factor (ECF subfamily)